MKNYMLPLGVDASKIVNPLQEAVGLIDKVGDVSQQAGKTFTGAFADGVRVLEKVDEKLKPIERDLEAVRTLGKQAGKELADAFNDRNINPDKFAKAIDGFKKKLQDLGGKIDLKLDDAKLKVYEKQLANTKNEVEELQVAARIATEVLNSLDPNSAEYKQLAENLTFVESALNEYAQTVTATTDKQKSLKAQLREMKAELAQLEIAGQTGSDAYKKLLQEAGALEDQIGDTNAQIKAMASDTRVFDTLISGAEGLTGAFVAVQGATALFGDENEALQKALLKVNGAMAILQGLQSVANTLNKDSAFMVNMLAKFRKADAVATNAQTVATEGQTVATKAATIATKGFSLALKAMGIGLIIGLIAYLTTNWDKLRVALDKMLPAGMKTANMFDTLKAVGMGLGNALFQFVIAPFKILEKLLTEGLDSAIEQAKSSYNAFENYQKGKQQQMAQNAVNHAMELKKTRMQQWGDALDIQEAEGRDVYNSRVKWHKNNIAILKREGEDTKEAEKELAMYQAQRRAENARKAQEAAKKAADDAKKAAEDAKRKAEENARKAAEEAKKQAEILVKFTREANKMKLDAMQDGAEKEKAILAEETRNRIEDLQKEEAKTAAAIAARAELIQKIKDDAAKKEQEIDAKYAAEKIKQELESRKALADLKAEGFDRDLELAQINHEAALADIREKYKNQTDLRIKLEQAATARYNRETAKITDENNLQKLDTEQKTAELLLELSHTYAGKTVETEEQKQLALLQLQLDYARKRRALLVEQGAEQNDILGIDKIIADTEKALADAEKKGKKFDIFKFLGFGDIPKEKKDFIINTSQQMLSDLSNITAGIIEQYQMQIDKKQEVIDQLDNEISDLEDRLDEEKQLRDEGFANDVENIERELAAKQAQKDEEIRQQKELQAKQLEMQRAQMIAETALQLVGMITSSVNIFKSATEYFGVFGVPIAIAAVGTMLGAFVAAKAKAFQAINAQQKMRGGGWIGGEKTHEQGGKKYYSEDGDGYEIEKDEFVVRTKSAKKYPRLLEAMNSEDFSGLTLADVGVRELFRNLGVEFNNDELYDGVSVNKELSGLQNVSISVSNGDAETLKSIDGNIRYLASEAREKVEVYNEGDYTVTKKGIRKTRVKK